MKNKILKVNCIVVIAALLCSMLFVPAGAAEISESGTCGENLTWTLDEEGTLTISGTGPMADYDRYERVYAPWFSSRSSIKKVVVESGITSIGNSAFFLCESLTSIYLPESICSIFTEGFACCTSLTSIDIPESVTSIDYGAFASCESLISIDLPESITSIAVYAFYGCKSLTSMYLPKGVSSINDSAFRYCTSLTNIELPECITSIGKGAFASCGSLTSIDIPEGVTSIGDNAFANCASLTAINVKEGNNTYSSEDGILFNKDKTTLLCYPAGKTEASYMVPSYVTSIGNHAFDGCEYLTLIDIHKGVTSIGESAFARCTSLAHIDLPEGITSIGNSVFEYCTSLTDIVLPEGVTSIGISAFYYCEHLTSISMPVSVTEIYVNAFLGCSELSDVYYGGTEEQWNEISNNGNNNPLFNATIHFNNYHKHSYVSEIITPATHLTEGLMTNTCGCGYSYTKTIAKTADHKYNAIVTAPTCTEQGFTTYTCECGDTYVGDYKDAIGHSYSDGICTECGGIEDGYVAIYSKEDLNNVRNDLNGKYILMDDIVFSDADFEEGGILYGEPWGDYGNGWLPFGLVFSGTTTAKYFPFTGVFNGNGHSIVNLKMNRETTDILSLDDSISTTEGHIGYYPVDSFGLFAYNEGTIKNLTLTVDFNIIIDNEIVVGGICGTNQGLVSDCRTEGSVYIENKTDHMDCYFGGIAGRLRAGTITRCSNDIDFSGKNEASFPYMNCGGIAGAQAGTANVISYCYNTGDIAVSTPGNSFFGGIVARTFNTDISILNCYNAGNIGYDDFKGIASGICAEFYEEMDSTAIRNCYNVGNIKAEIKTTGILYCMDNVEYDDTCYYLNVSADYGCCDYDDDNYQIDKNSLFSSQMKNEDAFDGFDFENVWIVDANADYPYPQLKNNLQSETELVRHNYSKQITKEATCTENGIIRYTCTDCGSSLDVDINATGHNYEETGVTPPTCTENERTTYTCSYCGDSRNYVLIGSATGHSYIADVTAPTCTEQGYTTYTCRCGDSYVGDYVDANGHSHTAEVTTPATHLTEGLMTYTCACGDTYTEVIAKTEKHEYNEVVTAPTCTEQGFTTYTCECGDTYTADFVEAVGHNYVEEVTAPTCEEKGYTTYTCRCGDSYISDYVDAKGHSYEGNVTTPATHLKEGVITYTCSCGDSYTEVIAKTEQHDYKAVVTAPTCEDKGYTTYTCECGDSYVSDYVDAKMHNFEVIITAEPDCKTNGTKVYRCECGYAYEESISRLGHVDSDNNGRCDRCDVSVCSHMCHKTGFMGFIWKIVLFFSKLFGINPVCECGMAHY